MFWGVRTHLTVDFSACGSAWPSKGKNELPQPSFLACEKAGKEGPARAVDAAPPPRPTFWDGRGFRCGLQAPLCCTPCGCAPRPDTPCLSGKDRGAQTLGLSHEGFGVLGSLHTGSPSGEWGDTSFWRGQTPFGNVWLGYMKSESISKALYGNLHQHLLFAMNPQKSFIHSKSRHCLPGGRNRAETQDNTYDGDRPALSSSSFQGRGWGGQGTGGDRKLGKASDGGGGLWSQQTGRMLSDA